MNSVIESLLRIVESESLPPGHASSHWQHYDREVVVRRYGSDLVLHGSGFGVVKARPAVAVIHRLERLSYYRVTARLPYYRQVWRVARKLARDLGYSLTFDVWRQAVATAVLIEHWAACGLAPHTFALIGDGHGFLGALIRRLHPGARIYCIDLPKMLVFQALAHERSHPTGSMSVILPGSRGDGDAPGTVFVLPPHIEEISDSIDCAINIASMQEMSSSSIEAYFAFLRRRSTPQSRFYCVNRRRKELRSGEVTNFFEYPWEAEDQMFLDRSCPYYTHFFGTYTLARGPRMVGVRLPFVNYFDGPIMERLVRLAPGHRFSPPLRYSNGSNRRPDGAAAEGKTWLEEWQNLQHASSFDFRAAFDDRNLIRAYEAFNDVRLLQSRIESRRQIDLLEVGCATGEFYRYLRHKYPEVSYYGIDISRPAVERAQSKYPEGKFFVVSAEMKLADAIRDLGVPERPEIIYSKDVVLHQMRPFEFVGELLDNAGETLIFRCRTRDVGRTELDPERSCQYHYAGWVPYIVMNVQELVDYIVKRAPECEVVVQRSRVILGGREGRFLPKECYLPETGTAETAVAVLRGTANPGKVVVEDRQEQGPAYTLDFYAKRLVARLLQILSERRGARSTLR